jgi:hypothetical protein
MKAYCPLINNDLCRYGGNKRYNYGIVATGIASYCRLAKKWVHDLESCPNKQAGLTSNPTLLKQE